MRLRAEVYSRTQMDGALRDPEIEAVYVPLCLIRESDLDQRERIILTPPVYLADCEDETAAQLERLKALGFSKALAHTAGHMELLRRLDFEIFGGARLNCANSETLLFFSEYGARDLIVSPEITAEQIGRLKKPCEIGFLAYGYLPLMITRRCPISNGKPCGSQRCGKTIADRRNRQMNVICSANTVEILNSEVLDAADKLDSFANADFAVLKFTVEAETEPVIRAYRNRRRTQNASFTRGLYFRGLKTDEQAGKENDDKS